MFAPGENEVSRLGFICRAPREPRGRGPGKDLEGSKPGTTKPPQPPRSAPARPPGELVRRQRPGARRESCGPCVAARAARPEVRAGDRRPGASARGTPGRDEVGEGVRR